MAKPRQPTLAITQPRAKFLVSCRRLMSNALSQNFKKIAPLVRKLWPKNEFLALLYYRMAFMVFVDWMCFLMTFSMWGTMGFGFLTIGSLVSKLQRGAMEKIHTVFAANPSGGKCRKTFGHFVMLLEEENGGICSCFSHPESSTQVTTDSAGR